MHAVNIGIGNLALHLMIRIGCSGWQYRHWRSDFYPTELGVADWLAWYARTFDTVELNSSFYRLPRREAFERWRAGTPGGFLFAVKASRYITHMKKLKDPLAALERFFDAAGGLGSKLGPVLYQLPPRWPVNPSRLEAFVGALPAGVRHVVEFRDASWYTPAVFEALDSAGVALCLHDADGSVAPRLRVGTFVYVRLHGVTRYAGRYSDETLADWAEWLQREHTAGRDVFVYFNNDVGGHAPRDAVRLAAMMGATYPASASLPSSRMPP